MATKKITLNELKTLVKQIIKEETNKNLIRHKICTYDDDGKETKSKVIYLDKEYNKKGPFTPNPKDGTEHLPILSKNQKLIPTNK